MKTVQISARLPEEDVAFLDAEVQRIGSKKTDRTEQLHLCITQRRIALMPKWKREKLYEKLGVSLGGSGETESLREGEPNDKTL